MRRLYVLPLALGITALSISCSSGSSSSDTPAAETAANTETTTDTATNTDTNTTDTSTQKLAPGSLALTAVTKLSTNLSLAGANEAQTKAVTDGATNKISAKKTALALAGEDTAEIDTKFEKFMTSLVEGAIDAMDHESFSGESNDLLHKVLKEIVKISISEMNGQVGHLTAEQLNTTLFELSAVTLGTMNEAGFDQSELGDAGQVMIGTSISSLKEAKILTDENASGVISAIIGGAISSLDDVGLNFGEIEWEAGELDLEGDFAAEIEAENTAFDSWEATPPSFDGEPAMGGDDPMAGGGDDPMAGGEGGGDLAPPPEGGDLEAGPAALALNDELPPPPGDLDGDDPMAGGEAMTGPGGDDPMAGGEAMTGPGGDDGFFGPPEGDLPEFDFGEIGLESEPEDVMAGFMYDFVYGAVAALDDAGFKEKKLAFILEGVMAGLVGNMDEAGFSTLMMVYCIDEAMWGAFDALDDAGLDGSTDESDKLLVASVGSIVEGVISSLNEAGVEKTKMEMLVDAVVGGAIAKATEIEGLDADDHELLIEAVLHSAVEGIGDAGFGTEDKDAVTGLMSSMIATATMNLGELGIEGADNQKALMDDMFGAAFGPLDDLGFEAADISSMADGIDLSAEFGDEFDDSAFGSDFYGDLADTAATDTVDPNAEEELPFEIGDDLGEIEGDELIIEE